MIYALHHLNLNLSTGFEKTVQEGNHTQNFVIGYIIVSKLLTKVSSCNNKLLWVNFLYIPINWYAHLDLVCLELIFGLERNAKFGQKYLEL
jgi:hypothetical protein